jgi:dipeptidase E
MLLILEYSAFLLVAQLYHHQIMATLAESIKKGIPYLGTSAGSNILGLSMQTTNDMPVIYPPSFKTLGILPFNINPHYFDSSETSNHMGETRETRINEFHQFNSIPVVGLREGSWIEVKGEKILLKGNLNACIFREHKSPMEIKPETDLSELN